MSIILLNIPPEKIRERRYDRPSYPDPGLGAVFSYLKAKNIKCHIIDSKLEKINLKELIKKIKYFNPTAIGLTSFTHEIQRVAYGAITIKKEFQTAKFIIGGPHSNALPRNILLEFPVFDIAVFGEGEATMEELIINNFKNLESIPGIAFRKNGEVITNSGRGFLNPADIPIADWLEFPTARYYPIFTSRGCPYHCIFCSRPFGTTVRYRPISDVIEEIGQIKQSYRPASFYFWDENFCTDRPRTIKLLTEMKQSKKTRDIKWFCQAHINNLDYDLLKLMKESGCMRIGIGIESGSKEILAKIGKGTTKEMICKVTDWLKKIKIPFEGYFLFGLPNETLKTCLDTIKLAAKINPKFPVFGIVVPYPGTDIYAMAKQGEAGYRIIANKWSDYNKIIGNALELKNLSRKQLELLQFFGYATVLILNFRFFDIVRFIFQFHRDILSYINNLRNKKQGIGKNTSRATAILQNKILINRE